MSKKLTIDVNNFPTGFYETTLNTNIPVEAIDITEIQWQEFMDNPGTRKWNTTTLAVDVYEDAAIVSDYKLIQIAVIDNLSEIQRTQYITSGSGQALTYQEKSEEASDYIAAGSPVDLTPYPFIQAEVNATGKTATVASNDILTAQSLWITKGSLIEEHRIKAKIDINAATTLTDIDNIVATAQTNIESV